MGRDHFRLLGVEFGRELLGVAARGLGRLALLILIADEGRAEGLDLFLRRRAHIGRGHTAAEAPGGRDGLQTRDARAHDEDIRGRDGAGGGHQHGEAAVIGRRRLDHRAVAREVGLGGEDVHRLRAGDARQHFHRAGIDAAFGIGAGHGLVGLERADQQRAARDQREFVHRAFARAERRAHLQHDPGTGQRRRGIRRDLRPRILEQRVGDARGEPGAGFHRHGAAKRLKFLHCLRRRGNPRFRRAPFAQDRYPHANRSPG